MSLFGSLYTGAAGMMAQAKATSMVSQNIANVSTTGYKRSEAFFHELVTTSGRGVWNGPGAVKATRILRADQQGLVQQSSSTTDAAISGNGFFAVKESPTDESNFLYTRNGAFSEDADGVMRNPSGLVLYGWQYDDTGNLATGGLESLVPVQVDMLDLTPIATTQARFQLNLNADETPVDPQFLNPPGQLPVGSKTPSPFSRTIRVYDGRALGPTVTAQDVEHPVTFEFRKIVGPMAHFSSNTTTMIELDDPIIGSGSPFPAIVTGDQFTLEITPAASSGGAPPPASAPETYTFVAGADDIANNQIGTVKGLIDALNAHGNGSELRASLTEEGRLLVRSISPSATITVNAFGPNNPIFGAGTLNIVQDPDNPADFTFEPDFDITATPDAASAYPDQADFPAFANTTDPNVFTWWEVSVMIPDPADPTGQARTEARRGLINFTGQGQLNALPDAEGNIEIDLATNPIDFDPAVTGDEVGFTVDISRVSQWGGSYTTITTAQNGAGAGQRTGVEFTEDGIVQARYSNGVKQNLYQIPLAVFANANGLDDVAGTAFRETADSGEVMIALPGTQGAGFVMAAALESSNVDIADEFARMMIAQRGYTLSSKVITTIDQMTERLSSMSR